MDKTQYYDRVVQATLINIYSCSKEKQKIILKNFDKKKKSHLLVLEAALMARSLFDFPIYIQATLKDRIWLRAYIHKKQDKILKNPPIDCESIDVSDLLKFEQCLCEEGQITFEEIYEAYYERKNKKWITWIM